MLPSRTRTARVLTTHGPARPTHPLPIRIMHWVGAISILCMMLSGWAIYNASPSLPFTFPRWMTLGGWLAGGIAWHISVMWVLFVDGAAYLLYGFCSGHFRRDIRPRGPRAVIRDMWAALTGRLGHRLGHYNAVQRLLYAGVIVGYLCLGRDRSVDLEAGATWLAHSTCSAAIPSPASFTSPR